MTRTGTPSERSLAIASAGVNPRPPATTRSGSSATIFSTSTVAERGDVGERGGLGRVVAAVVGRDDAVAGADREQRLGGGRRQRDDLLRLGVELDRGALVVGQA